MPNKPKVHRPHHALTKPERDKARPNATERGYDSRWRKLRDEYLLTHPWCERCAEDHKPPVLATMVHHKIPVNIDPSKRLDATNLKALCGEGCHQLEHANDTHYAVWKKTKD